MYINKISTFSGVTLVTSFIILTHCAKRQQIAKLLLLSTTPDLYHTSDIQ